MCVNGKFITGLLDTGIDVSIITPESWHPHWPLQEVEIQFLGLGNLSRVRQSTRWVNCIGPDRKIGKLRPYVANIAVNLLDRVLLQQWNTQINIPAASRVYSSEENITRYYIWWTPAIRAIQEHNTIDDPSEVPTAMPLKWLTEKPIWTKQWPLAEEKLQALEQLVQEQLDARHTEESTSPWNSSVFVVKKKNLVNGEW